MSGPPHAGPDFTEPAFATCYRHPERQTGIRCQRCQRPICGECMNPASVGFQCPRCVSSGRAAARAPRTRFGAAAGTGDGSVTKVIMGIVAGVWLLNLVSRGLLLNLLALSNVAVVSGEFWRLFSYGFTSAGLLGTLMNLLVLWLAGRAIESELGAWRFAVLYVACGLGGATVFFLLAPLGMAAVGASSAVVGLLAANAIFKARTREDIRPDVGLLVVIVLYGVLVGFSSYGWLGLIGGIAVGAVTGLVLAGAPRQNRTAAQTVGLLGIVAACLVAVVGKILALV